MAYGAFSPRERVAAALPALVVVALLGWGLVLGLSWQRPASLDGELTLFEPLMPPPSERARIVPARRHVHRPRGEAAPPNLRSVATELVAPPPIVPPTLAPLLLVSPVAGPGADASAGAALVVGPGTGAGGRGNGQGSGGSGDGDGDGLDTPPRRIRGKITDRDWPAGAAAAGASGVVSVRYHVEVDGRATECRVTHSSGSPELDETTCRLIEQRFRYRPSLDADGRPVRSIMIVDHEWINDLGLPDERGRR